MKKNKIIIIILLLILIFSGVLLLKQNGFFSRELAEKNSGKLPDLEQDKFNEQIKQELVITEKQRREFLTSKEALIKKKAAIMEENQEYSLIEDDCDRIADSELKSRCYEYLRFSKIISVLDLEKCGELNSEWQDACLYKIIRQKRSGWNMCARMRDIIIKDACFRSAAAASYDILFCDQLSDNRQECEDLVKMLAAKHEKNIKECENIKSGEYFKQCVTASKEDCAVLANEDIVRICESWRFFDDIIAWGAKEDCAILLSDKFKKVCAAYFDNGKKFIDSDQDGVSDREELNLGADPFNKEPGIKELLKEARAWTKIYTNIYYTTDQALRGLRIDSDNDGLRDYEEKEIYKTDPKNPDTDSDGYNDGDEAKSGFNPLGAKSIN